MSRRTRVFAGGLLVVMATSCGTARHRGREIWADEAGLHAVGPTMLVLSTRAANVDERWFVATAVLHDDDGDGALCRYRDRPRVVVHRDGREESFDAFVGMADGRVIVVDDDRLLAVDIGTGVRRVVDEREVACRTWGEAACSDAFVDHQGRIVAVTPRNSVLVITLDPPRAREIAGAESPVVRVDIDRSGEWLALWSHGENPTDVQASHCEGPSCESLRGVELVSLVTGARHSFPDAIGARLRSWGGVVRIGDDVVQFGNDGSRVLAEGCWTEAVGFESPVVVLRCEDERRVVMPADPSPIDVAWIALLRDDQWVTAEWRDDDALVSMGERAWTREGDAWVSRTDAPPPPCPVLALGQDRRALVLGAVEAPSCGYLAPQRFAWTDPISPDLCATPPRLGSYRDR